MEQILNAIKALAQVCDHASSRDLLGFNGFDANYVHDYLLVKPKWNDRDTFNAWKMLRKYRKQLQAFGINYDDIPMPTIQTPVITPKFSERWHSLNMYLTGTRITAENFAKYRKIHENLGFTCTKDDDGQFAWYLKKADLPRYNHQEYCKLMGEIGISVHELPEEEQVVSQPQTQSQPQPSRQLSAREIAIGIRDKRLRNHVAVICEGGDKFSFHFPFNDILIDLFSNKSGQLSGITEFNLEKKTRETHELETVLEAIEKIKALLPDWTIATEGVDEAVAQRDQETARNRIPIPEVAAVLNPEFSLFPFQNEGVRYLIKNNGLLLCGWSMGLGKTLLVLSYAASQGKRCLIVCPKVVRRTWCQEAERFFPSYFAGKAIELRPKDLKKGISNLDRVNLASVNYESLEKFLPAIKTAGFDTIVIDESHRFRNPKAKITKTIMSLRNNFKHRILLSGTAIKNKKIELLTQTDFIQPGLFTKDELHFGTIGGCWNKLKKSIYIAKRKEDVLPDLPDKISQIVELEVVGMPSMPDDLGEMTHVKVTAAIAKVNATVEFVEEILESSDSCCLVFSESVEAAEKIAAKLGDVAILHHGQMSDDKREAIKEEFQKEASTKRVLVSTRQSLSEGVTLTRADRVVFNDLPWTASDISQAESRCHRIGQRKCVNVYWMSAAGSEWDKCLTAIIRRKYELTKKVNEGKQLTKDEQSWLSQPITLEEVRKLRP